MRSYPPTLAGPIEEGLRSIKRPARRFDVRPTLDGFEVIDYDGRPVADEAFIEAANDLANELNAVADDRKEVAKRLAGLTVSD